MIEQLRTELESDLLSDFPNDEEKAKAKAVELWREACKEDFNLFTEDVLGFNNAPHQVEWCGILGNQNNRQIVVAAPRGHSKTTVFSVNYPLWEIARNPDVRILLVSAADTQSQSFLREIKGRIERDQIYVNFAGRQLRPDRPEKWTDKEIILKRDRKDVKDPTISTVSVEGTILSKRADIIICDDLLNFENTRTPEQRQKIKDWFNLVLLPVLEPKTGRLVVAGTVWQVGDLMEELMADPTFDYRKKYKAIIQEPTNKELWEQWCDIFTEEEEGNKDRARVFLQDNFDAMYEGVEVLWPERVGYEELYIFRYKDPYAFARSYMNDPASRPSQMIKREWIERALARGVGMKFQDAPHTQYIALTTEGVDLAISQETLSDDTSMVILDKLEYDWNGMKKGNFIIRQLRRGKMTGGEIKSMVTTDFYALRPHGIRVESNAFQAYLVRELNDNGIPVKGHRTGSEKLDSSIGVTTIGTLLEHDQLTIPSDPHDARTKDLVGKLVAGMLSYPEGHTDDSLMALWFAYLEMVELTADRIIMPTTTPMQELLRAPLPAEQGTVERTAQEKEADAKLIGQSELQRSRALYWKSEEKRLMGKKFGR